MPKRVGYCLLTRVTDASGTAWVLVEWSDDLYAVEALKRQVPARARHKEADGRWRVQASYEPWLVQLARTFTLAELHDGNFMTDLRTGKVREQLSLF